MRHVDRRHRRRLLRLRPEGVARSPTRSASRWRPTTVTRQARQLALGLVAGDPGRHARRPTPRRSSSTWATSRTTSTSSATKEGWADVPPGTRTSLYENPEYQKAAPFAKMTLEARSTPPTRPSRPSSRCPMSASSSSAIPEFQGIGTTVGQQFAAALAGQIDASTRRSQQAQARPTRDDDARPATSSKLLPSAVRPAARPPGGRLRSPSEPPADGRSHRTDRRRVTLPLAAQPDPHARTRLHDGARRWSSCF